MDFLQRLLRATDGQSDFPQLFFQFPEVAFLWKYVYTLIFHRLPQTTISCFIFGVYGSSVWDWFYITSKEGTEHIKQVFLATVQISDMRFVGNCFLCWFADFGLTSL